MTRRAPRHSGALLLTVCVMLAMLAALAFSLGRSAGMGAHSVAADYERRSAAYLAQAGVAAAKWNSQLQCGSGGTLTINSLNGGKITAAFAKGAKPPAGSPPGTPNGMAVTVNATSAGGATATAGGANINVVDLSPSLSGQTFEQKPLGGITDTTIGPLILVAPGPVLNTTLTLNSNQAGSSTALLQFPMKDVPAYAQVINATLNLTQTQTSSAVPKPSVSLYRMTTAWKNDATAAYPTLGASWTGNDYSSVAVGSASTATTAMSWNVTSLVDGWISGLVPDDGMMLRLNEPGQTTSFYSNEAGAGVPNSAKPTLTVSFAKPCP
jgi:hypothetical protein